jgi:hypothetical protein
MQNKIDDEIIVYDQNDDVKGILNTLIDNIYQDNEYQEYLQNLEEMESLSSAKKLANIKKTFTTIQAYNTNKEPLFIAKDIGTIIGTSNVNQVITKYNSNEKCYGYVKNGEKLTRTTFLTKHGIYRIMFNGKSKLSEIFRGVVYSLIDYMADFENKKFQEIITDYASGADPAIVNAAKRELADGMSNYKRLYEKEFTDKELALERLREIEIAKAELESDNTYNEMHIAQLKLEKNTILTKLYDIKSDVDMDENQKSLALLKKKFLKEFSICLVNPTVLDEIFYPISTPKKPKHSLYELNEQDTYDLKNYKNNFSFLINHYGISKNINTEQIFYLYISYKSEIKSEEKSDIKYNSTQEKYNTTKSSKTHKSFKSSKMKDNSSSDDNDNDDLNDIEENEITEKYIHVASEYIMDKIKFDELHEMIQNNEDSTFYILPKATKKSANVFIYKTSIDTIQMFARDILIS